MKKTLRSIDWTPEEEAWLEVNYKPLKDKVHVANFLNALEKIAGRKRTLRALKIKASRMGLKAYELHGMPTATEAAVVLGVNPTGLRAFLNAHPVEYPTVREGRYLLVPAETYSKLEERYRAFTPTVLARTVTAEEARALLCICQSNLRRFVLLGLVREVAYKKERRYYRDDLESVRRRRDNASGAHWISLNRHFVNAVQYARFSKRKMG